MCICWRASVCRSLSVERAVADSKRVAVAVILLLVLVAGCVRPDKGPSPFENLQRDTPGAGSAPQGVQAGPDFKIIPDSELVYGPALASFALSKFIEAHIPELKDFREEVDGQDMTAADIILKVSRDYSVSPRLLLVLLKNFTGDMQDIEQAFIDDLNFKGLFPQLSWAADQLNRGYYTRRVNALNRISLADGTMVDLSDQVSAGTAALQYFYGLMYGYVDWLMAVGPLGLYADYLAWFDDPHAKAVEPLIPDNLTQPDLRLPYSEDEAWYFTSGPHSAWGAYAAWAALDFAPEKPTEDAWGCYQSSAWVRAVADGRVVRISDGLVVQELDDDHFEGSGWSILYMHIAEEGRVERDQVLKAGDPVGHPSCEGGPASGTHLHIARRYNGEWIPTDQDIPFILNGWVSTGFGVEYDGSLTRDGQEIQASGFPTDENKITY